MMYICQDGWKFSTESQTKELTMDYDYYVGNNPIVYNFWNTCVEYLNNSQIDSMFWFGCI